MNGGEEGISPSTHKIPNHWVETDRAAHPKRFARDHGSPRVMIKGTRIGMTTL